MRTVGKEVRPVWDPLGCICMRQGHNVGNSVTVQCSWDYRVLGGGTHDGNTLLVAMSMTTAQQLKWCGRNAAVMTLVQDPNTARTSTRMCPFATWAGQ